MTKDEVRSPALTVTMDIIGSVRANGWRPYVDRLDILLWADSDPVATIHCKSASQAKRLAEMMRAPTPVLPQQRNRPTSEPGGCECVSCGAIFIGGPTHDLCGVCAQPATPVFDAMNLPETPAFPSVRGKA